MPKYSSKSDVRVVGHSNASFEIFTDETPARQSKPKDRLHLVYLVFLLHGVGILLPWNLFINAKEYFEDYKLNTTLSADADYRKNFMNYIGLASQLPNLLMSAFNVFFQSTRPSRRSSNASRRIMLVIFLEIGVCATTVALALVDTTQTPRLFFDITVLSVALLNCCTGVYQSSAFGMAALLPMSYTNAIVLGCNMCGTLVAVVNIVCKLASTKDMQLTAVCYFIFAIMLLLLCAASLLLLPELRFYRQELAASVETKAEGGEGRRENKDPGEEEEEEEEEEEDDHGIPPASKRAAAIDWEGSQRLLGNGSVNGQQPRSRNVSVVKEPLSMSTLVITQTDEDEDGACWCLESAETAADCFGCCCPKAGMSRRAACSRYWLRYWLAFKDSWLHCLSVWNVFFCTLSCFPAIQSNIRPTQLLDMSDWFTDIFVFLFFNLFAMLGNATSGFVQLPTQRWLWLCVLCRCLLSVPFFLLCNCFPGNRKPWLPVLVGNDYAFIAGMILFAFTSGHFSSLAMMYAPSRSRFPGEAAMVATFFLAFGIFSGISFGGVLFNIIQQ